MDIIRLKASLVDEVRAHLSEVRCHFLLALREQLRMFEAVAVAVAAAAIAAVLVYRQ